MIINKKLDHLFHRMIFVDVRGRTRERYNTHLWVTWYFAVMVPLGVMSWIYKNIAMSVVMIIVSWAISKIHSRYIEFKKKNCWPWIKADSPK